MNSSVSPSQIGEGQAGAASGKVSCPVECFSNQGKVSQCQKMFFCPGYVQKRMKFFPNFTNTITGHCHNDIYLREEET
jgi:hypothetical protein